MKITIIGFGSWGIPLGCLLHKNGHKVTAWDNAQYVEKLLKTRRNEYLPEAEIPPEIEITSDISAAANGAKMFVFACTSRAISKIAPMFAPFFTSEKIIVNTSKGLEETNGIRISQFLQGIGGAPIAVLSGPSHAEEVLKGIPTTVVAASENESVAMLVQEIFSSETFRVYTSTDVIGAEMGGALKNVIALAAGCSDGLGFGDNTKAALITRGIAEITRLGVAMGADERTFAGLSGIGDLIVTCTSKHSRNWRAGFALAQGKTLAAVRAEIGATVEGADTAAAALALAKKHSVDMPIIEETNRILFDGKSPKDAVVALMLRERKQE
ncbi:MAG: NAD(P)-dependent glycerol-3-phosphate dehydrogenase [Defluviitaleaceae bacterium]|nr:NAD(P)-dependent glycerol-3-phosphate dehydrogenase [Defluviitaleaceae bacterium]